MGPRTRKAFAIAGVILATLFVGAISFSLGSSQRIGIPTSVSSTGGTAVESGQVAPMADQTQLGNASTPDSAKSVEGERSTAPGEAQSGDRVVIVNASMEVRVDDVDSALDSVRAAVRKAGAEISDLSMSSGDGGVTPMPLDSQGQDSQVRGPSSAIVTIRVPADKLDALTDDVSVLGTVLAQTANATDVTEQSIDLKARLRNLRAEEARLRSFLDRTEKVSDLLAVERELSRVRGEIEAMDAQLTYLERQAARATLTVALSEPGPVVQPSGDSWGLTEAITRGIQATAALIATMITIAIPLAFLAMVLAIVVLPIRWFVRRRHANREDTPTTKPDEESAS